MANNPDFKKIILKDIELQWPRLDQPYRYNERDEKSEPCAPTAPQAAYSVGFTMTMEDAQKFRAELVEHYNECRARNSKLPEFNSIFGAKVDEENNVVRFTAKKNAVGRDGTANKIPQVVGNDLKELDDKAIWSGSKGHLRALAFPATNPTNGVGGISLMLDAVQVVEAAYGSDGLEDDFGPAQAVDPFNDAPDTPKAAPAPTPAPEPAKANPATAGGF